MNIKVKVKNISKLKDLLTYEKYVTGAETVEELIREMVKTNVMRFNNSRKSEELFLLPQERIENMAEFGKLAFGGKKENKRKVDVLIMQEEAVFQFKNRRFKIINESKKREYKLLEEKLDLNEEDCLIFIKLAMLAGRSF